MNELIKITENENGQVVNAKELYLFLGYDISHWAKWVKRNIIDNDFAIENEDYTELAQSARSKEFAISIKFAKKISMMAKTDKGEEAREYFLKCEKIANSKTEISVMHSYQIENPAERARAWAIEFEEKQLLELQNSEMKPKVVAFENVIDNANTYTLDSVSDILDIGRTTLCKLLEQKNWKTKKETHGTSSTRYAEENGYAKTIYEYIKINNNDIKTKRFVLKKKGLEKLISEFNK